MTSRVDHIDGETFHGRGGGVENAFRYSIDYVALDPEGDVRGPKLFSRNKGNFFSLRDSDHGGAPKNGSGAMWVREILRENDLSGVTEGRIELLAQPRVLGHVFNPVAFWMCHDGDDTLRVVIAEVSNTFGDRHSYLVHHDDLAPITREDSLAARKIFHVSPFQPIEGGYTFRFDMQPQKIGIFINYQSERGTLIATLTGSRKPLTNAAIVRSALRRPFGSRRVLSLIHWQALKLWWKGARFHSRPAPPKREISR
jgi:DUF1365 family protein